MIKQNYLKKNYLKQDLLNQDRLKDVFYFSARLLNPIHVFWLGFIIYTASYVLSKTGHISTTICFLIQVVGLVLFLPAGIYLTRFRIKNKYLRTIFIFYCFWLLTVICRGIKFNYASLHAMLLDADYGIFLYFSPLILLFPNTLTFYKKVFDVIAIFGIIFIIYDILFIKALRDRSVETRDVIEHFAKSLSLTCGFLTLTYLYHSGKRKLLAWAVMIITLLFTIYKARRGLSLICASILAFSYLLYSFNNRKKLSTLYLTILIVLTGAFYASTLYKINNSGLLGLMAQRGDADTRSVVEIYFSSDMRTKDWIVGKGINGEYFCPDCEEEQETNYRAYIETGYLQIVLKGGITMLTLYLLITIPAIFLGIFYSKNTLSRAAGIWIFISLISLYPATVNTFCMGFLLVWVSVGICYSKKIRSLSDSTIKEFFSRPPEYL